MRKWLWLPWAAVLTGCAQMGVETLPAQARNTPVAHPAAVGLPSAPEGYRWYRSGPEFVLAATLSGRVLQTRPAPNETPGPINAFGSHPP